MKIILSLFVAVLAVLSAHAATFNVTTNSDAGTGSLRQAITDANAAAGADIITFDPALNGRKILLTSGQLGISNSVSILGPGPDQLAIDGNGIDRVFYLAPGQTNRIAGLTLTNGYKSSGNGGGIHNDHAFLTISNVTLTGNLSGDLGGGVCNDASYGSATLTVQSSTFSSNSTLRGGAIYNNGYFGNATLTVQNSTLNGNSAPSYRGGGVFNDGYGGHATLTILNSTLSGNSASYGGGISSGGGGAGQATLTILNSTLNGNSADYGGGIFTDGSSGNSTLTISDTLLAKGGSGENYYTDSGSVTNLGYNLSDDASTAAFATTVPNLLLGPLTNNGGPTLTCALLLGSPAYNAGDPAFSSPPFTDQRGPGYPRVLQGRIDIGAFESLEAQCLSSITVVNTNDDGPGSLRQALLYVCPDGTITFAPALNGQKILLTSGQLVVTKSVSIFGPGPDQLAIDGNGISRVFYLNEGLINLIAGLTVTNGHESAASGGGIYNLRAFLTISNVTLSGNSASFNGGGIYSDGANDGVTLIVQNCTFTGNSADAGGGIFNHGNSGSATLTIQNSTLGGNSASGGGGGGGIYNNGRNGSAMLTVQNCTLSGNSSLGGGGGIYNSGFTGNATLMIQNSTLSGNSTTASFGGGINNNGQNFGIATLTIRNSTLSGNSTGGGAGGSIYNIGNNSGSATLTIANTLLAHGTSGGNYFNNSASVTNLGYNLSDDASTAAFAPKATNLFLGPLAANGGPTLTHALLYGSPAFNAGNPAFAAPPDFDQRGPGFLRVVNGTIDIGAFEAQTATLFVLVLANPAWSAVNHSFSFTFTGISGTSFSVLTTTNLAPPATNWTLIGFAIETPAGSGQFQFTDPQATNSPQRYFRVRSP